MTTNATVGVSFSAGSVAKRILLFAINFFVLVQTLLLHLYITFVFMLTTSFSSFVYGGTNT